VSDDRIFINPPNPDDMINDWHGSAGAEMRFHGTENELEGLAGLVS
jgi:hypothetical protein